MNKMNERFERFVRLHKSMSNLPNWALLAYADVLGLRFKARRYLNW